MKKKALCFVMVIKSGICCGMDWMELFNTTFATPSDYSENRFERDQSSVSLPATPPTQVETRGSLTERIPILSSNISNQSSLAGSVESAASSLSSSPSSSYRSRRVDTTLESLLKNVGFFHNQMPRVFNFLAQDDHEVYETKKGDDLVNNAALDVVDYNQLRSFQLQHNVDSAEKVVQKEIAMVAETLRASTGQGVNQYKVVKTAFYQKLVHIERLRRMMGQKEVEFESLMNQCTKMHNEKEQLEKELQTRLYKERLKMNDDEVVHICVTHPLNTEIIIKKILGMGAINDPVKSKYDDTLLHFAVRYNRLDFAEFLLANGALWSIKNNKGKTPFNYVCKLLMEPLIKKVSLQPNTECLDQTFRSYMDECRKDSAWFRLYQETKPRMPLILSSSLPPALMSYGETSNCSITQED